MQPLQRLPLFLQVYPLALVASAVVSAPNGWMAIALALPGHLVALVYFEQVAFGFCQWFHVVDVRDHCSPSLVDTNAHTTNAELLHP